MSNILKTIVAAKRLEVADRKLDAPLSQFEKNIDRRVNYSLKEALIQTDASGIIAEIKRRSPSRGDLNTNIDVEEVSKGYVNAGASALSVLTDNTFFGGSMEDLKKARASVNCPILRKDFIIDGYQVFETKYLGADVMLLIASILTASEIYSLALLAKSVGLEVLLEIHLKEEVDKINDLVDIVGVNNRNLNDFTVSIDRSLELYDLIPSRFIKISESGIDSPGKLLTLKEKGFKGFLMGEAFMTMKNPGKGCTDFINDLKITSYEN